MKNKLKLPAINKSSSYSNNLDKKNTEPNAREAVESSSGKNKYSSGKMIEKTDMSILSNYPKKMELDKYALRHL